jgi:excisionase family DNA binding protein
MQCRDNEDVNMPDIASSAKLARLSDTQLLDLYLSLPPAVRENVFVNTAQAARVTGVSMRTIQLWIESGAVRAIAIGRKYQVVLESLRAHLRGQMSKRA